MHPFLEKSKVCKMLQNLSKLYFKQIIAIYHQHIMQNLYKDWLKNFTTQALNYS